MTGLALVIGWFCQMLAEFSTAWNRSQVATRIDPDRYIKEQPSRATVDGSGKESDSQSKRSRAIWQLEIVVCCRFQKVRL